MLVKRQKDSKISHSEGHKSFQYKNIFKTAVRDRSVHLSINPFFSHKAKLLTVEAEFLWFANSLFWYVLKCQTGIYFPVMCISVSAL